MSIGTQAPGTLREYTPAPKAGKYRPEQKPNFGSASLIWEVRNVGTLSVALMNTAYRSAPGGGVHGTDHVVTYHRWADEPGIWRDEHFKLLPAEELHRIPGIEAELAERRLIEDRERARDMVASAFVAAGSPEVIEARGDYELREQDGGFTVWSRGIQITPHAVPENIAHGIFLELAGPLPDPDATRLDKVLAA